MPKASISVLTLALTVLLMGCESARQAQQSSQELPDTACRKPRPEVCTFQYQPVCGLREGGQWQTFGNGCMACSEVTVIGHRDGACEEGEKED